MHGRKFGLYTIIDTVAEEIAPIFQAVNDYIAKRHFDELLLKSRYPKDFKLVKIGEFDTQTMVITPHAVTAINFPSEELPDED